MPLMIGSASSRKVEPLQPPKGRIADDSGGDPEAICAIACTLAICPVTRMGLYQTLGVEEVAVTLEFI